jgi:hypothetical protein
MGILNPAERNELLNIEGLRKFVNDEERKYLKLLKDLKGLLRNDAKLTDPWMLAAHLAGYLRLWDEKLRDLMYRIWRDDDVRINKFYDIIAKYFVDREAAT